MDMSGLRDTTSWKTFSQFNPEPLFLASAAVQIDPMCEALAYDLC